MPLGDIVTSTVNPFGLIFLFHWTRTQHALDTNRSETKCCFASSWNYICWPRSLHFSASIMDTTVTEGLIVITFMQPYSTTSWDLAMKVLIKRDKLFLIKPRMSMSKPHCCADFWREFENVLYFLIECTEVNWLACSHLLSSNLTSLVFLVHILSNRKKLPSLSELSWGHLRECVLWFDALMCNWILKINK